MIKSNEQSYVFLSSVSSLRRLPRGCSLGAPGELKRDWWSDILYSQTMGYWQSIEYTHTHIYIYICVCVRVCKNIMCYLFYKHDSSEISELNSYHMYDCICSTGLFQFRWLKWYLHSSCYYHHQIGFINLSHCYQILLYLCAWDVSYIIFCHLLHIHSGKNGILVSLSLCSLCWVQIVGCLLAFRSCSFVCTLHHLIIIIVQTEDIELIKCLSDICCRVCKIKQIFCFPSYNIWGCAFSVYPFTLWWLREYTLVLLS